jgi:hypothetical protein
MSRQKTAKLDFERRARTDWLIWLFLLSGISCTGVVLAEWTTGFLGGGSGVTIVFSSLFLVGGIVMLWIGASGLILNTSRGCSVDPATGVLTWWHMKGARQFEKHRQIAIADITRITAHSDGDTTRITIYSRNLPDPLDVDLQSLPPNYRDWIATLQDKYPHIDAQFR